jgi:hypothetical protein
VTRRCRKRKTCYSPLTNLCQSSKNWGNVIAFFLLFSCCCYFCCHSYCCLCCWLFASVLIVAKELSNQRDFANGAWLC